MVIPAVKAADDAACLVLCALNLSVSMPPLAKPLLIHGLNVCDEAGLCGFFIVRIRTLKGCVRSI